MGEEVGECIGNKGIKGGEWNVLDVNIRSGWA